MARLYQAEGDAALACEHLLSRALVARSDPTAQVEAVQCGAPEARVLSGLEEKLRARVERQLERAPKVRRLSGPWRLEATWDGDADLDLLAVSPEGEVVSWQGGADVRAEGVRSERGEELVFKARTNGRWQLVVVRKDGDDRVRVEGTLRVTSYGVTRRIPFVMGEDEKTVTVSDVDLATRFRWQEVSP
jgi:hypothetical protein